MFGRTGCAAAYRNRWNRYSNEGDLRHSRANRCESSLEFFAAKEESANLVAVRRANARIDGRSTDDINRFFEANFRRRADHFTSLEYVHCASDVEVVHQRSIVFVVERYITKGIDSILL